jgi:hypothetical protein
MHFNHFDNMILGTINNGQGFVDAVDGTHRAALRVLIAKFARRLSLRLERWRALSMKRTAGWRATPGTTVSVVAAMCPSYSGIRRQRVQRWMPGVVATSGTVGVS